MAELITEKHGPWTFDDLQSLPESCRRYEIVDGVLVMTPSPGLRHEAVSFRLRRTLDAALAPPWIVFGPMGVDLHASYRIPDLVVVDQLVLTRDDVPLLQVSDVRLAIEIVSPGSVTTDRITKPAQYAAAGIAAYWRVETADEVTVTAYALHDGDEVYTELGTWREGDTLRISEPFAVEVAVSDLAP